MKVLIVAALLWATPIAKTNTSGNTLICTIKEKKEKGQKERKEKAPTEKENNRLPGPTMDYIEVCNF